MYIILFTCKIFLNKYIVILILIDYYNNQYNLCFLICFTGCSLKQCVVASTGSRGKGKKAKPAPQPVAAASASTTHDDGVMVECFKDGSKIRVKPISTGYDSKTILMYVIKVSYIHTYIPF